MKKFLFLCIILAAGWAANLSSAERDLSLVAHYTFDGNASDSSGNGLHGTVYNSDLTTDRFGNENSAYSFNGTDSYIQVNNNALLQPSSVVTVSAWIFSNYSQGSYNGIVNNIWDNFSDESGYGLCYDDAYYRVAFISKTNGVSSWWGSGCNYTPENQKWIHLTGTYDGSNAKIYADGVLINSIPASGALNYSFSNDMWIGRYYDSNEEHYFNGKIDDIRIYSRALSENEVQALYESEWIIPPNASILYSGSGPELSWQTVTNATSYNIYSSPDPNAAFPSELWTLETEVMSGTQWTDEGATDAKKFYVVVAVD